MQAWAGDYQKAAVREAASRFLEAIKNSDSKTFWDTLDKRGKGYFLGMWFYAMESMSVQTIVELTGEAQFLDGVLEPIIAGLQDSMGDLLESPVLGEIQYSTPYSAAVRVSHGSVQASGQDEEDYIPLVLELSDEFGSGGESVLTCWKVDTLQCFQLNKTSH